MTTDGRPVDRQYFISVEVGFFDHPKVLDVGPELAFAVMKSWAYCHKHLTDGFLPVEAARQIVPKKSDRDRLVKAGWWDAAVDSKGAVMGYLVHDYLRHQPSRAQMRRKSEVGRSAARSRWDRRTPDEAAERSADGNATAMQNASVSHANRSAKAMQSQSQTYMSDVPRTNTSRARGSETDGRSSERDGGAGGMSHIGPLVRAVAEAQR